MGTYHNPKNHALNMNKSLNLLPTDTLLLPGKGGFPGKKIKSAGGRLISRNSETLLVFFPVLLVLNLLTLSTEKVSSSKVIKWPS